MLNGGSSHDSQRITFRGGQKEVVDIDDRATSSVSFRNKGDNNNNNNNSIKISDALMRLNNININIVS